MRHPDDVDVFVVELGKTAETFAEQVSESRALLYFEALADLPIQVVLDVLQAARQRCKFFPKPAELREFAAEDLSATDGHLGPEEAWALVASLGEDDTVVWTDEIAAAWGAAQGALPDRVAARMAFLEVYRRTLAAARRTGTPASWWPSLGWKAEGHLGPIVEAVARGRLPQRVALGILPPSAWPEDWQRALAGSSAHPVLPPPEAKRKFEDLRGGVTG